MSSLQEIHLRKIVLMSGILLSGCGSNFYSIHRVDNLDPPQAAVVTVDAKQRFLLSNVVTKTTEATPPQGDTPGSPAVTQTFRRYCAEPSPDVFSVLGQALSAGGSLSKEADPASISLALRGAFSSSESGSTIARTQTVNMLKEMMYRTCERYLNGQIGDFEYPIIAARDQRIMTSILAIEQLTGAVLPKAVVIAATGSAAVGQSSSDAIIRLDDANKKKAEKESARDAAQKELDDLSKSEGSSCQILMSKKDAEVAEKEKEKQAQCKDKQESLDKATRELAGAQKHYDQLAKLAGGAGVSAATTDARLLSSSPAANDIDRQIEADKTRRVKAVTEAVKDIVLESFQQEDETAFFCYRAIERNETGVRDECVQFLTARVAEKKAMAENRIVQLKLEAAESLERINESKDRLFKEFWEKVKKTENQVDRGKLKALIANKFPTPSPSLKGMLDAMKNKTTRNDISKIFNDLSLPVIYKFLED